MAEFTLANGADINLRSNSKKTPLHYAAQYNRLALAKRGQRAGRTRKVESVPAPLGSLRVPA